MILICKAIFIVLNLGLFIGSVMALKNINKEEDTVRLVCYIILVSSVLSIACLLFD